MTPFELIACCLAASAVIEVWFEATLFEELRSRVRAVAFTSVADYARSGWWARCKINTAYVWTCWYCLSYWAGIGVTAWFAIGLPFPWLRPYLMLPVYAFAIARVVTIVNGLLPGWLQAKDILPPAISANTPYEDTTAP